MSHIHSRALGLVLVWLSAVCASGASAATLFVSPSGNDAWSGRLPEPNAQGTDGPLATLSAARDAVRRLRAAQTTPEGITVLLRGGTYTLSEPLVFRPEDSGSEGAPVVWAAYPGERPVISSGRLINGWRKVEGELWVAEVPKGWYFTRLFVNGQKRLRAREPDTDNWNRWWQVVDGGPPEPDAPEGMGSKVFIFPPGTLRNWPNLGDIEINSLPSFRYANFIAPLAQVDEATGTATLTSQAYYNFRPGDPFRVENVLDALDRPGEWCLNSVAGTVHYWPLKGEDLPQAQVTAPALCRLVSLLGDEATGRTVHDLVISGLTFTQCDRRRWHETPPEDEANLHVTESAVYLECTERCAIEDCRFVDVAGFAVRMNLTAIGNRFVRNEVVGAGCGGLQLGGYGPGTKDVNRSHIITHNHIHHCSTDFWHAGAIDLRQSGHNLIAYNLIHDMPYTAITIAGAHTAYFRQYRGRGPGVGRARYNFRWDEIPDDNPLTAESVKPFLHGRNNIVEHNVVYEVLGRLPADGGALYGFGQGLGNVFRNNLVYRAHCLAIYLDNEFDGVRVERNLVYDSAVPFGGSGSAPTLVDNALYETGKAPNEVRLLAAQMTRMAEQATGPSWYKTVAPETAFPAPRPRDPDARQFSASFAEMLPDEDLPGQGGWQWFGPGSPLAVAVGTKAGAYDPGLVAVASGNDSWAAIQHGLMLEPARDLVLELVARLPDPPQGNSFFELYLNRAQTHAGEAFGVALLGGAEDGAPDLVGARQDAAGPRVLASEHLTPGHWYRLRLTIPANSPQGRVELMDLTAGETVFRPLVFTDGKTEVNLMQGQAWSPEWPSLDTLVLRLGGGAEVASLTLANG